MNEKIDVAQLVIRTEIQKGYSYFLARRTKDSYWEWIGGKKKDGENIEEAAVREMKEELRIEWNDEDYEIRGVADSYPSSKDSKYMLNPVLIEVDQEVFNEVSEDNLSREHDNLALIDLKNFGEYETLGQYQALERLDLVEGDVAVAVIENQGEYLMAKRSEENSSSGRWTFISGKMENGEKPEEATKREVKEETGLEVKIVDSGDPYIGEGELGYWRLHPFLVNSDSREVELNWELSNYKWLTIEKAENMEIIGELKALEKLGLR